MTTEEFEKIAVWMGWKKVKPFGKLEAWERTDRTLTHTSDQKTSLTNSEAVEALNRLVEKGCCPEMYYSVDSEGFAAWYFTENPCDRALYYIGRTLTEAVERALLQIAAKEE